MEGTGAYGAALARLLHRGVQVVEVDRSDRKTRRMNGKSNPLDAYAAAIAALSGGASGTPKSRDGRIEAIRALRVARRSAVKARTQVEMLLDTGDDAALAERRAEFERHPTGTSYPALLDTAKRAELEPGVGTWAVGVRRERVARRPAHAGELIDVLLAGGHRGVGGWTRTLRPDLRTTTRRAGGTATIRPPSRRHRRLPTAERKAHSRLARQTPLRAGHQAATAAAQRLPHDWTQAGSRRTSMSCGYGTNAAQRSWPSSTRRACDPSARPVDEPCALQKRAAKGPAGQHGK